ncbi:hypothetical protein ACP70R_020828 [Stipagrostis hirtigluma subsp. patula]
MAKVKRSAPAPAAPAPAPAASAGKASRVAAAPAVPATANVIEIPSSPDPSDGGSKGSGKKKSRKRPAPLDLDEVEMWTPREKRRLDDDCQILAGDPLAAAEVAPAAPAGNEDITVVAERGKVACRDYPHPRSACAKNPFSSTPHERHCDKLFLLCVRHCCPMCVLEGSWGALPRFGQGKGVEDYEIIKAKATEIGPH